MFSLEKPESQRSSALRTVSVIALANDDAACGRLSLENARLIGSGNTLAYEPPQGDQQLVRQGNDHRLAGTRRVLGALSNLYARGKAEPEKVSDAFVRAPQKMR